LLPHAATLLPPLFAHKQGFSEDWWQCGSRLKKFKYLTGVSSLSTLLLAAFLKNYDKMFGMLIISFYLCGSIFIRKKH
jgi:hypothetical protein